MQSAPTIPLPLPPLATGPRPWSAGQPPLTDVLQPGTPAHGLKAVPGAVRVLPDVATRPGSSPANAAIAMSGLEAKLRGLLHEQASTNAHALTGSLHLPASTAASAAAPASPSYLKLASPAWLQPLLPPHFSSAQAQATMPIAGSLEEVRTAWGPAHSLAGGAILSPTSSVLSPKGPTPDLALLQQWLGQEIQRLGRSRTTAAADEGAGPAPVDVVEDALRAYGVAVSQLQRKVSAECGQQAAEFMLSLWQQMGSLTEVRAGLLYEARLATAMSATANASPAIATAGDLEDLEAAAAEAQRTATEAADATSSNAGVSSLANKLIAAQTAAEALKKRWAVADLTLKAEVQRRMGVNDSLERATELLHRSEHEWLHYRADNDTMKHEVASLQNAVQTLQAQQGVVAASADNAKLQLAVAIEKRVQAEGELARMRRECGSNEILVVSMRQQIHDLDRQVVALKQVEQLTKASLEEVCSVSESRLVESQDLGKQLALTVSQRDTAAAHYNEASAELQEVQLALKAVEEQYADCEAKLRLETTAAERARELAAADIRKLQAELELSRQGAASLALRSQDNDVEIRAVREILRSVCHILTAQQVEGTPRPADSIWDVSGPMGGPQRALGLVSRHLPMLWERAQGNLRQLEAVTERLKGELETQKRMQDELFDARTTEARLLRDNEMLSAKLSSAEFGRRGAEANLVRVVAQATDSESRVTSLQETVDKLAMQVSVLMPFQAKAYSTENQATELTSKLEQSKTSVKLLEEQIAKLTADVSYYSMNLDRSVVTNLELVTEIKELRIVAAECEELRMIRKHLEQDITTLQEALDSAAEAHADTIKQLELAKFFLQGLGKDQMNSSIGPSTSPPRLSPHGSRAASPATMTRGSTASLHTRLSAATNHAPPSVALPPLPTAGSGSGDVFDTNRNLFQTPQSSSAQLPIPSLTLINHVREGHGSTTTPDPAAAVASESYSPGSTRFSARLRSGAHVGNSGLMPADTAGNIFCGLAQVPTSSGSTSKPGLSLSDMSGGRLDSTAGGAGVPVDGGGGSDTMASSGQGSSSSQQQQQQQQQQQEQQQDQQQQRQQQKQEQAADDEALDVRDDDGEDEGGVGFPADAFEAIDSRRLAPPGASRQGPRPHSAVPSISSLNPDHDSTSQMASLGAARTSGSPSNSRPATARSDGGRGGRSSPYGSRAASPSRSHSRPVSAKVSGLARQTYSPGLSPWSPAAAGTGPLGYGGYGSGSRPMSAVSNLSDNSMYEGEYPQEVIDLMERKHLAERLAKQQHKWGQMKMSVLAWFSKKLRAKLLVETEARVELELELARVHVEYMEKMRRREEFIVNGLMSNLSTHAQAGLEEGAAQVRALKECIGSLREDLNQLASHTSVVTLGLKRYKDREADRQDRDAQTGEEISSEWQSLVESIEDDPPIDPWAPPRIIRNPALAYSSLSDTIVRIYVRQVDTVEDVPCWGVTRGDTIFDAIMAHYNSQRAPGAFTYDFIADPDGPVVRLLKGARKHKEHTKAAMFGYLTACSPDGILWPAASFHFLLNVLYCLRTLLGGTWRATVKAWAAEKGTFLPIQAVYDLVGNVFNVQNPSELDEATSRRLSALVMPGSTGPVVDIDALLLLLVSEYNLGTCPRAPMLFPRRITDGSLFNIFNTAGHNAHTDALQLHALPTCPSPTAQVSSPQPTLIPWARTSSPLSASSSSQVHGASVSSSGRSTLSSPCPAVNSCKPTRTTSPSPLGVATAAANLGNQQLLSDDGHHSYGSAQDLHQAYIETAALQKEAGQARNALTAAAGHGTKEQHLQVASRTQRQY